MRSFKRFPWSPLLAATWLAARLAGIDFGLTTPAIWVAVIGSVGVMMAEFYKSSDVLVISFEIDLLASILATIIVSSGVTVLWTSREVYLMADGFVIASVLADAIIGPRNSFRTALRNIQAGVNQSAIDAN